MLGIFLILVGLVMSGISLGNYYSPFHGWITIGGGLVILGILVAIIEYLEDGREKS